MGSGPHAKSLLLTQVLTVNTIVIMATFAAAIAVGANLNGGDSTGPRPLLTLGGAILANNFVLRRRFAPLDSLTKMMERVDLLVPGTRTQPSDGESADVSRLRQTFNVMLSRLESDRVEAASAVLRAQESERAPRARSARRGQPGARGRLAAARDDRQGRAAGVRRGARRDAAPRHAGDARAARPRASCDPPRSTTMAS